MSLAAVREVEAAQKKAVSFLAEQNKKAKEIVLEAEKAGREMIDSARRQADEEGEALLAKAREENGEKPVLDASEKACADLRGKAKEKIAAAADAIVERIVNG